MNPQLIANHRENVMTPSAFDFDGLLPRHNLSRLKGIGELLLPLPLAKAIDSC
jgi:hypothetical protein